MATFSHDPSWTLSQTVVRHSDFNSSAIEHTAITQPPKMTEMTINETKQYSTLDHLICHYIL